MTIRPTRSSASLALLMLFVVPGCGPSKLPPMGPEGDKRLIGGPDGEEPGDDLHFPSTRPPDPPDIPPSRPSVRRQRNGSSPITTEELAASPFHEVSRVESATLSPLNGKMYVTSGPRLGEMRSNQLVFDESLLRGATTSEARAIQLLGEWPNRAWLRVSFPPKDESPPKDEIYRYSSQLKRWKKIARSLQGGAQLVIWKGVLLGVDTKWGQKVQGGQLRLLDGWVDPRRLPRVKEPVTSCEAQLGGLEIRQLHRGLLVMKAQCTHAPHQRLASIWRPNSAPSPYQTLPLPSEQLLKATSGPLASRGSHIWLAFDRESEDTTSSTSGLLHFNGESWSETELPLMSKIVSLSALADGTLWITSGEQKARIWVRSTAGETSEIATPNGVGPPRQIYAVDRNDVWLSTESSVYRTIPHAEVGVLAAGEDGSSQ